MSMVCLTIKMATKWDETCIRAEIIAVKDWNPVFLFFFWSNGFRSN